MLLRRVAKSWFIGLISIFASAPSSTVLIQPLRSRSSEIFWTVDNRHRRTTVYYGSYLMSSPRDRLSMV
jgi:hypothetical protein